MCLVLPDPMNSYYCINLQLGPFYSIDLHTISVYILWEEVNNNIRFSPHFIRE